MDIDNVYQKKVTEKRIDHYEEDVKKMPVEDIKEEIENDTNTVLYFTSKGTRFWMYVYHIPTGGHEVESIEHHFRKVNEQCPYCRTNESRCSILTAYSKDVFERLITSNAIRLPWLFRNTMSPSNEIEKLSEK